MNKINENNDVATEGCKIVDQLNKETPKTQHVIFAYKLSTAHLHFRFLMDRIFTPCRCKLLTAHKFSNLFDELTEPKKARCLQGGLKICDS